MKFIISICFISALLFTPSFALAQAGSPGTMNVSGVPGGPGTMERAPTTGDSKLFNPLGEKATLITFLNQILDIFIKIGTLVIITMIIYIGFLFVAAQGAPEKISDARKMLLWTLIGGLILLGAKGISLTICNTVNAITPGTQQCK